jgi:SAM-dependent methyltransferase
MSFMSKITKWRSARGISLGDLRTLRPVSTCFGQDRGTPIRRYFIDQFFANNKKLFRGNILEIGDARYARVFAPSDATVDILDPDPASATASIHGDLLTGEGVPENRFDVIILTQVLHVLSDMKAAVSVAHRALKPGGCVLATLPCITQVSRFDMDRWGDYWRTTDLGARTLFESSFRRESITVTAYGNVLTAIASLTGLSAEDLRTDELDYNDPDYQVLIAVCAVKDR